jgi:hypothetical protein
MPEEFPEFEFSVKAFLRAGEALKGEIIWPDDEVDRAKVFSESLANRSVR